MPKPKLKNKGFLLLEVLISIVIVTTTLIIINRAFSTSLKAVQLARDYFLATCILEDKVFDIQTNNSAVDISSSYAFEAGAEEFFCSLETSPIDTADYKDRDLHELALEEANIKVSWPKEDSETRLNVLTYVWKKETE